MDNIKIYREIMESSYYMPFGKYKGEILWKVFKDHFGYIKWCAENRKSGSMQCFDIPEKWINFILGYEPYSHGLAIQFEFNGEYQPTFDY